MLPSGPHLLALHQSWSLGGKGWHAVAESDAKQATQLRTEPHPLVALCGASVRLWPAQGGVFDRAILPAWLNHDELCPYCSWQVATEIGGIDAELAALTPTGDGARALTRLGHDPAFPRRICEAVIDQHRRLYGEPNGDDQQLLQILATVSLHAPTLAVPENCGEGSCDHRPEDALGDPGWTCGYPDASYVCPACTLRAGHWAGEWEGQFMSQCYIHGPCQVLLALAQHHGVPLVSETSC